MQPHPNRDKNNAHSTQETDILIIGSGASGLALALTLADTHRVTLITKNTLRHGSSAYAQGGIAAVLDNKNPLSIEKHIQDTLKAGAGLCNQEAVRFIVNNGSYAIHWLVKQGVEFTTQQDGKTYHLTREGGHSERRIVHVKDRTGDAIIKTLSEQVWQRIKMIGVFDEIQQSQANVHKMLNHNKDI